MEEKVKVENRVVISNNNPSIERDEKKCKKCGMCKIVCNRDMAVDGYYDSTKANFEPVCINCGRCVLACPFGALSVKSQTKMVVDALEDKKKVVVMTIAPATRVAFGEAFGEKSGKNQEGKMVAAAKKMGAKFVFDTAFGADLTIMEEASEFVQRVLFGNKKLPQFTSCCPAWVKYAETFLPHILPNLSSARSPIAMQGTMIKTYFAKKAKIDPSKIFHVAVVPCSAKKAEFLREENNKAGLFLNRPEIRDVDAVISTNEFVEICKQLQFEQKKEKDQKFDGVLGYKSGAGVLFGSSGGVMEAVLRTAYFILNEKNPPKDLLKFAAVRGEKSVKEATADLGKAKIKVAAITGTANAREYIVSHANDMPAFIEVMACENGCVGGAGQPKISVGAPGASMRKIRQDGIYKAEKSIDLKCSHENPEIKAAYSEFLQAPLSDVSEKLLHTTYTDRSEE